MSCCGGTTNITMRQLVLLFALVVAACDAHSPGLRVRFDVGPLIGKTHFIPMPLTLSEALKDGWSQVERPADLPLPSLNLYCPNNDRVLCLFYDDTDYVAGLQIGLPEHSYYNSLLNFKQQGFTEWTTVVPGDAKRTFWTLQQYFVSEETLQQDRDKRIANRNKNKLLQNDGVWVTGFNGELLKIGGTRSRIEGTIFKKQGCLINMGRHFYYNMTKNSECNGNGLYPWFPIVHSGELVATGFLSFGQLPASNLVKDYFERPNKLAVKIIVPDGPDCLYDLADDPGLVTMHIYYVDAPWTIGCLLQ